MVTRFYPALAENRIIDNKGVTRRIEGAKNWGPQNEGISVDMYENKGQKKLARRLL
jgi:hypothetical protein